VERQPITVKLEDWSRLFVIGATIGSMTSETEGYELFHEDAGLGHTQEEINQLVEEQKATKEATKRLNRGIQRDGVGVTRQGTNATRSADQMKMKEDNSNCDHFGG